VVIDDVGHYEAVAIAEFLVKRGCRVTFATRFPAFAPEMESSFMNNPALSRLYGGAFSLKTRTRAVEITHNTVVLAPTFMPTSSNQSIIDADLVVVVSHNRPNRDIFEALSSRPVDLRIVGDAQMPRNIQDAIRDGHLAGAAV
jgi:thioredoxin reductase